MSFTIEAIWAFLAVDKDAEEGVIGAYGPEGWLPFVAADADRLLSLKPRAQAIAKQTGMTVRLVKFTTREDVETLVP